MERSRASCEWGPAPAVIAARIRAERLRLGLTEREAAHRLGVSRASWRQYEAAANPQARTLVGFAVRLGFRIEAIVPELLGGRVLLSDHAIAEALKMDLVHLGRKRAGGRRRAVKV